MKETTKTFKKVVNIDLFIGAIIGAFIFIFVKNHTIPFFIGLFVTIICFAINTFVSDYCFNKKGSLKSICLLGFFFRVILVSFIALMLCKVNKYYIFSYILGYNCNILSLLIYSKSL